MTFNINEVIAGMANAVKGVVKEDWPVVKNTFNDFMQDHKGRLDLLADMRLHNEISQEDLEKRLQNEQLILQSELHAISVITKAVAQAAANAALKILSDAITAAIKLL